MITEQLFDYETLNIQELSQAEQIPDMEVLDFKNRKVKLALSPVMRGRGGARKIVGMKTPGSARFIYVKDGEEYKAVRGELPLDGEYFIKKSTGEKKIAMPTGRGLQTYEPFVKKGSEVREKFKEAVGKYFEEFIVNPS